MNICGFDDGAYRIVLDAADFRTYTDEQGVVRVRSYLFNLYGFCADDSLVILKPGALTVLPDLNADIHAQAAGGIANGQYDITLMGVFTSPSQLIFGYDGPAGLNALPVGDISVLW